MPIVATWMDLEIIILSEMSQKVKDIRTGENNSKSNNWQRINFQNIQVAHSYNSIPEKPPN